MQDQPRCPARIANGGSMAKLDTLFQTIKDNKASDLHLVVGEPPKMRVHGTIKTIDGHEKFTRQTMAQHLCEILRADQLESYKRDRDLDFAYALEGVARFRC